MTVPRQMTAHTLEAPKGWPSQHAVDVTHKISANVTIDPVFAGRVVYVNATEEFEMGIPNVNKEAHVACFLWQNSDDPDVANPGGSPANDTQGAWVSAAPAGNITALAALGSYELQSTEFEAEATAGTYTPGDALTATASNSNATTGGRITRSTAYDVPTVGIVSRLIETNSYGVSQISFWPAWLPRLTGF